MKGKRAGRDAQAISVLPMEIQVGDRFTDEAGEWEVVSHPVVMHTAKSLRVSEEHAEVTGHRASARARAGTQRVVNRLTFAPVALALAVLAGCATLTPEQADGLKKAQRFADEVTDAYGVARVRVIVDETGHDGFTEYWERNDWITIRRAILDRGSVELTMVGSLAAATFRYPPQPTWPTEQEERRMRFEKNRRGVEIMVTFLGMTTRQAVGHYAATFVARSKAGLRGVYFGDPRWYSTQRFLRVGPCEQLHDLWSHFAIADPPPKCEAETGRR